MGIQVDLEKCNGCKKCVLACPFGAVELVEKKAEINYDECTICGACANACEFDAIQLVERIDFPIRPERYRQAGTRRRRRLEQGPGLTFFYF